MSAPLFRWPESRFDHIKLDTEERHRTRLLEAYYCELNDDAQFRADLSHLFNQIDKLRQHLDAAPGNQVETIAPYLTTPVQIDKADLERRRMLARLASAPPEFRAQTRNHRTVCRIAERLETFARRWRLPHDGLFHLAHSFDRRSWQGEVLGCGFRRGSLPRGSLITPSLPLPFLYVPVVHNRKWLKLQIDEICRDIRESILAQAETAEGQAGDDGHEPVPPVYQNTDKVEALAHRLYLRVVKSCSWQQIADKEGAQRSSVRESVENFAKVTGVPLPNADAS
jgi:hypothetical protein